MIALTPQLSGFASTTLWYRYRVREHDGAFRVVRDYGPEATLHWTSIDEGSYDIEVSVRDRRSGETAVASTTVNLTGLVTGEAAVVTPTAHPLVYLYSAPCEGGRARVRFTRHGGPPQYTPWKDCSGRSINFYLAGLTPMTAYSASVERSVDDLTTAATNDLAFTTGQVSWTQALPRAIVPAPPAREGVLLQSALFLPSFATDMEGNLLWYGPPGLSYVTNPVAEGTFWALAGSTTDPALDRLLEFDLIGMTVRETNAARVNEQLEARGLHPITGFHHDARPLPGGRVVVLASEERLLTGVQGPGTVDVLGDMILVLDADMQVVWAWDAFDHLDTARAAVLGETCAAVVGCAVHYLAADANDWTHGNAVAPTPDGNLLYSARHQDWIIKIDYADGAGSGRVLWRLGAGGDFRFESTDPYPWFSHQHDAHFENEGSSTIVLFDNGNTRVSKGFGNTSRGQAIEIDEKNMVATLRLNADLHFLSGALGSAQRLAGGNYHFDAGLVANQNAPGFGAYSLEVDSAGAIVASLATPYPVYRSFRLESLYGATDAPRRRAIARP